MSKFKGGKTGGQIDNAKTKKALFWTVIGILALGILVYMAVCQTMNRLKGGSSPKPEQTTTSQRLSKRGTIEINSGPWEGCQKFTVINTEQFECMLVTEDLYWEVRLDGKRVYKRPPRFHGQKDDGLDIEVPFTFAQCRIDPERNPGGKGWLAYNISDVTNPPAFLPPKER